MPITSRSTWPPALVTSFPVSRIKSGRRSPTLWRTATVSPVPRERRSCCIVAPTAPYRRNYPRSSARPRNRARASSSVDDEVEGCRHGAAGPCHLHQEPGIKDRVLLVSTDAWKVELRGEG